MIAISERIKEAMTVRNMKQNELAEKAGVTTGALSSWLNGRYVPKQKSIYKLAQALDVSELWLLGDEKAPMEKYHQVDLGEIIDDKKLSQAIQNNGTSESTEEFALSESEIDMIETFRDLDDFGKDTVKAVLEKESERCRWEAEHSIEFTADELRKLPLDQRLKFEPHLDDLMLYVARSRKPKRGT